MERFPKREVNMQLRHKKKCGIINSSKRSGYYDGKYETIKHSESISNWIGHRVSGSFGYNAFGMLRIDDFAPKRSTAVG